MHDIRPLLRSSALVLTLLTLAGCSGDRVVLPGSSAPPAAAQIGVPSEPPVNLAGRWLLSSPSRGQCRMTFGSASPTATEGTIAPEGGCPGKFFTSRKWTYYDQVGLTMRDHTGQPLAQLTSDGAGFQGKATSGDPVALTR